MLRASYDEKSMRRLRNDDHVVQTAEESRRRIFIRFGLGSRLDIGVAGPVSQPPSRVHSEL